MTAVKTFHRLIGQPVPNTTEHVTNLTLKGIRLDLAQPTNQASPISPQILITMFVFVNTMCPEQVCAWTAVLYAFHLLLRKSNLVPDTQGQFNALKQLSRSSITLAKNAMLIHIVWSKTLPFREKDLMLPLVALDNKVICPIYWTWKMISMNPASPSAPALSYFRGNKFMVLTYPRLTFWFRKWLILAGYQAGEFSSPV